MLKNSKYVKLILSLVIFLILLILASDLLKYENEAPLNQTQNFSINTDSEKWTTYDDKIYHYTVDYPTGLVVTQKQKQVVQIAKNINSRPIVIDGGVNFSQGDGYGVIDISIFENTDLTSTHDWLETENKNFEHHRQVIEKEIKIDNVQSIITHSQSDYENELTTSHEKTLVFIRDGTLFKVVTRFVKDSQHQRVWDSFNFTYD